MKWKYRKNKMVLLKKVLFQKIVSKKLLIVFEDYWAVIDILE